MEHKAHRRTHFLVNGYFQLKYTVIIAVTVIMVMLITGFGIYFVMWSSIIENFSKFKVSENMETAKRIAGYENARYIDSDFRLEKILREAELLSAQERNTLGNAIKAVNKALLPRLIIILVVVFIGGILVSHGIAGPMYHFAESAEAIRSGDLKASFRLRKNDEMKGAAAALEKMGESLRPDIKEMKKLTLDGDMGKIKTVLSKYKV